MKCNKKNCPLVGNNENCDIKECKWRTEDTVDSELIRISAPTIIVAWIRKKLGIMSPSTWFMGYPYEYDMLRARMKKNKGGTNNDNSNTQDNTGNR